MIIFSYIILYIAICWFIKAIFSEWLYPWTDAKVYAGIYEAIIQKDPAKGNGLVHNFWRWLFKETNIKADFWFFKLDFPSAVPKYRVFQKLILLTYWLTAYFIFYRHFPWWVTAGCFFGVLWAYYWMKHERKYYYWAGQETEMYLYQSKNENVYWLKRIYFSGKWLFAKGFIGWKFDLSSIIGTIGLYLTTAIMFFIYYLIGK